MGHFDFKTFDNFGNFGVKLNPCPVVKVVKWSRGAHLTKPGWSKPHTHSPPNYFGVIWA